MPLTVYCVHFKSMGPPRGGHSPAAKRRCPCASRKPPPSGASSKSATASSGPATSAGIVAGDFNDYRERVVISEDEAGDYAFEVRRETGTSVDVLAAEGFGENMVERRPPISTAGRCFTSRGPQERHLCQLDYLIASQALADANRGAMPRHLSQRPAPPDDLPARPGCRAVPTHRLGQAQGLRPLSGRGLPVIGLRRTVFTLGS